MNRSGEIEGVVPSGEFLAAEATDETKPSSGETKTFALPSCERSAKMDKPSGENSAETAMPEMSIEQMLELLGPDHPIHYTFGLPHWVVGWMGFVSLLYVVLAPWLLWHAADQPLALVCTFSLLACSYLFFWIHCLSETMSVLIVFFRMSYIALLSSFIGHLIGPVNGMAVVYLETFYAAGMLGYAVAEYRQLVGSERSASAVVGHSSESKEKQRRREEWVCYIAFLESCPSLMFLARMVWLVLVPDADRRILFVVMELSLETCGLSFYWGAFVALIWLDGALISVDTVFCRVTVHFGAWCVLSALLTFVVGDAAGMLVLWLITMVMVGFFGYSLAVYAHYKQILATRNQKPTLSAYTLSRQLDERDQKPGLHFLVHGLWRGAVAPGLVARRCGLPTAASAVRRTTESVARRSQEGREVRERGEERGRKRTGWREGREI